MCKDPEKRSKFKASLDALLRASRWHQESETLGWKRRHGQSKQRLTGQVRLWSNQKENCLIHECISQLGCRTK